MRAWLFWQVAALRGRARTKDGQVGPWDWWDRGSRRLVVAISTKTSPTRPCQHNSDQCRPNSTPWPVALAAAWTCSAAWTKSRIGSKSAKCRRWIDQLYGRPSLTKALAAAVKKPRWSAAAAPINPNASLSFKVASPDRTRRTGFPNHVFSASVRPTRLADGNSVAIPEDCSERHEGEFPAEDRRPTHGRLHPQQDGRLGLSPSRLVLDSRSVVGLAMQTTTIDHDGGQLDRRIRGRRRHQRAIFIGRGLLDLCSSTPMPPCSWQSVWRWRGEIFQLGGDAG